MTAAFSQAWGSRNASSSKSSRFALWIEWDGATDDVFIVSHGDVTLEPGVTVLQARVESLSVTSQTLYPDEGRTEIGNMSFEAIDAQGSITDSLRTNLLDNARGLRKKTIRLYIGFEGLQWEDWHLTQTQVVSDLSYEEGVYRFTCTDISREVRKEVFNPVRMVLTAPLTATDTTVSVTSTVGLEAVEHGDSWSDAPNATVAYVKIDDEIIRVASANIGATSLTSVTRGVLGTRAVEHSTDENAAVLGEGKEVTEVIYLELPAPKLAYALLTGILFDQTGTLPDHWHAGVTADFVKASDFQTIGADWYDPADETKGVIFRFVEPGSTSAKSFIEEQVCRVLGAYMPIDSAGQMGFRRMSRIVSDAPPVAVIDASNMLERPRLRHRMDRVHNNLEIKWNEVNGKLTRTNSIRDDDSIAAHGETDVRRIEAYGLHGTIHSGEIVRNMFDALRDRYANPPIETSVDVLLSMAYIEVADIVRLVDPGTPDFTNAEVDTLDRSFEVQGVTYNWSQNRMTLRLFSTSTPSGPLPPLDEGTVISDAWFSSAGTNLASLAGVTDNGTNLTFSADVSFAGNATMGAAGSILYATKDVVIGSTRTLNVSQNTMILVKGVLQINGQINGKGNGLAGVSGAADVTAANADIPGFDEFSGPVNFQTTPGNLGYFGVTQADGGLIERVKQNGSRYAVQLQSFPATITQGRVQVVPPFSLRWDGSALLGIPTDLRGTSGGPGGVRYWLDDSGGSFETRQGGTGGDGGAGLVIVSRGVIFGASGVINTSGDDGLIGAYNAGDERPAHAGSGAGGAPGAILIVIDGATNPSPPLTGHIVADYGASPQPADGTFEVPTESWFTANQTRFTSVETGGIGVNRRTRDIGATSGRSAGIAAARVQIMVPDAPIEPDQPDIDLADTQSVTISVSEAYTTRVDPTITTILVESTEVTTTDAYSHVMIYAKSGSSTGSKASFIRLGPAEPDATFDLPANGSTWNLRAYPVLINGVESDSVFSTDSITVADGSLTPAAPDGIVLEQLSLGVQVNVTVPASSGVPSGVKVYFGVNTNDTFAETALADAVGVTWNGMEWTAQYVLAGLTEGDDVYVFAKAFNSNGESGAYPSSGSGVTAVVLGPGSGSPGSPGADAVDISITSSAGLGWVRAPASGAFTPSGTTTDLTFTVRKAGSSVATRVLRITRDGSGNLTVANVSNTGEATSWTTVSGSGTKVITVRVTHDMSGRTADQTVTVVEGGANGSNGSNGSNGADGEDAVTCEGFDVYSDTSTDGGTTWAIAATTVDRVVSFYRLGSAIATGTIRAALTLSGTPACTFTLVSTSGETLSLSTTTVIDSGGILSKVAQLTHTGSGAKTGRTVNLTAIDFGSPGKG